MEEHFFEAVIYVSVSQWPRNGVELYPFKTYTMPEIDSYGLLPVKMLVCIYEKIFCIVVERTSETAESITVLFPREQKGKRINQVTDAICKSFEH